MSARFPPETSGPRSNGQRGPELLLAAASLVGGAVTLVVAWTAGPGLVLPVLSGVLLASGLVIALISRGDPADSPQLTFTDVGAALVFAGFAAALISDLSHVIGGPSSTIALR